MSEKIEYAKWAEDQNPGGNEFIRKHLDALALRAAKERDEEIKAQLALAERIDKTYGAKAEQRWTEEFAGAETESQTRDAEVTTGAQLISALDEHVQTLEARAEIARLEQAYLRDRVEHLEADIDRHRDSLEGERNEALTIGLGEMRVQRNEEAAAALLATEDRDRALMALDEVQRLLDPALDIDRAPAHERIRRALAFLRGGA